MNKKIIVSVLAGGGDHYEQMEAAARETCFKNPPENISIYYIHNYRDGVALQEGESRLIEDCFYYGGPEGIRHCLRKCVEFWGYCLENFEFDYIFRPNLGCWVSMDALNKLVNTLPMEGIYGGAFGTTKGRRRGIEFVSGSGFLLSRDVVQLIWDYHLNDKDITIEYDGNSLVDDVAIGAFLSAFRHHPQKGINIERTNLPRIDLHESEICPSRIDPDCHHYYFLHPKSPNCYHLMGAAILEQLKHIWSEEEKIRGLKLFTDVYNHLITAGTFPSIAYGTLLGCCRNGKTIPWDGDFDIYIDIAHWLREPSFEAIEEMGYGIVKHGTHNYKVFYKDGLETGHEAGFKWPWVDIDLYRVEKEEVHFMDINGRTFYKSKREEVFPFECRIFEDIKVLTPKCPESHLDRIYPDWRNTYTSSSVNHKRPLCQPTVVSTPISPVHQDFKLEK